MNWTEEEYVKRAADIAKQSLVSKKTVNDVCEKAAKDDSLNPEEIRTLVRMSNVAVFQQMFKQKDSAGDPDRHVEFEVGDPETVIQRLHQAAAEQPQSASIMNDKLSSEVPDMMASKRRGFELDNGSVKVASDNTPKAARTDMVILTMRKLAAEYDLARLAAGFRWEEKIAAIYDVFHKAPGYGPNFLEFEKDAFAEYSVDKVAVEIGALRSDLKITALALSAADAEKLAEHRLTGDSRELRLLKEAADARSDYEANENAHAWVLKNTPSLGK